MSQTPKSQAQAPGLSTKALDKGPSWQTACKVRPKISFRSIPALRRRGCIPSPDSEAHRRRTSACGVGHATHKGRMDESVTLPSDGTILSCLTPHAGDKKNENW
ncbi:hypothetical protein E4U52_001588 [Claviceps spartinae]|nr:hypothetical protein E4U52_001588 [Claviceps spartinae]